ncbi:MAG TPA: hypothetical protein VMG62_07965 [Solirubrobacteraceae bacterium]|nr:hypothetical protein [Solirubrobacteraceae bacterium]
MRENAACALGAGMGSLAVAWLGLYGFAWNDYEAEAQPAVSALVHGQTAQFLRLAPSYGGSLVERAPFALAPGLWGGGELAVYRMLALPCLLAAAALAVWLCARMRAAGRRALARALAVGICVANPLTLQALELGHPEEALGACLCVAAVLLAARGRAVWAGVALGLAIANKEWALLAVGPVLLALLAREPAPLSPVRASARRRLALCLGAAGAVAGAILAPLLLVSAGGFAAGVKGAASPGGQLFQPWQVWWFLGHHGAPVRQEGTPLPGYRVGPEWTASVSHPLIVALGVALPLALWLVAQRTGRRLTQGDALLALALALLARCVLDTWDIGYYMLPFLLALLTWECLGGGRPLLTTVAALLPWIVLARLSAQGISPDVQAALFLAWTLPLAGVLALRLYAPHLAPAWQSNETRHERELSAGWQGVAHRAAGRVRARLPA